jgi:hypothetical protein
MGRDELIDLEERAWFALSCSPLAAAAFYEQVLSDTVLMLLPGGMVLDDRAQALQALSGQTWSSWELSNLQVLHPTPDTGVVTSSIVARQPRFPDYSAAMSSLYVRDGDSWKLTFHQRTSCRPVSLV